MNTRTPATDQALYKYMISTSLRESNVLKRLREETDKLPERDMLIAPEQGQFMAMLVHLLQARKALDIGTFTGYSALVTALAMPEDGVLYACEINEHYAAIARRYWSQAGVADKIRLQICPAAEMLDNLLQKEGEGSFDLAFIDADSTRYDAYYERSLRLVRKGGLILVDDVFQRGRVADPGVRDPETQAMRVLNAKLLRDDRVLISTLPIADGITLALKR